MKVTLTREANQEPRVARKGTLTIKAKAAVMSKAALMRSRS